MRTNPPWSIRRAVLGLAITVAGCGAGASANDGTTPRNMEDGGGAEGGGAVDAAVDGAASSGRDRQAPTIPTSLSVASSPLDPSNESTNTITFDYPSDPFVAGALHSGLGRCSVFRDGDPLGTVPCASPGRTNAFSGSDIGAVGAAGRDVQAPNGTDWSVTGAGADIFGAADAFRFDAVSLTGQGTVVVKLRALSGPGKPAEPKAGVMFRASHDPSSAFVLLAYQSGNATLQFRGATGDAVTVPTYTSGLSLPLWLKLSRAGGVFTASTSSDGNAWTSQGTATVALPSTALVGLAVTSQAAGKPATAKFEQVNVASEPPLSYEDPHLPAGTTHAYSVSCQDRASPANVSAKGSSVTATTPSKGPALGSTAQLLSYIKSLPAKSTERILIGQHTNYWDGNIGDISASPDAPMDNVTPLSPAPAVLGLAIDFLYSYENELYDPGYTAKTANAWIAAGGIVEVSLWSGNPAATNSISASMGLPSPESGEIGGLSPDPSSVVTPGSYAFTNWQGYLDQVASVLQAIHGPVIMRPFVEINGNWNWPSALTATDFITLWKETHDYLTKTKGVSNVLWLYNMNAYAFTNGAGFAQGDPTESTRATTRVTAMSTSGRGTATPSRTIRTTQKRMLRSWPSGNRSWSRRPGPPVRPPARCRSRPTR